MPMGFWSALERGQEVLKHPKEVLINTQVSEPPHSEEWIRTPLLAASGSKSMFKRYFQCVRSCFGLILVIFRISRQICDASAKKDAKVLKSTPRIFIGIALTSTVSDCFCDFTVAKIVELCDLSLQKLQPGRFHAKTDPQPHPSIKLIAHFTFDHKYEWVCFCESLTMLVALGYVSALQFSCCAGILIV